MNELIKHRGPDGEGYFIFDDATRKHQFPFGPDTPEILKNSVDIQSLTQSASIALGHRRLSIIDTSSAGHQPFYDKENGYVLVVNGEIYNFLELKEDYLKKGYAFKSQSDSEVIIAAYHFHKEKCLSFLSGMFSFILFDIKNKKILIARDRFGIKPLYLFPLKNGGWAVASEIKQFSALNEWHPTINKQRIYDFLVNGEQDHTNETMFKNVFQMPPGSYLYMGIDDLKKKLDIKKYYSPRKKKFSGSFEEASKKLYKLLNKSVKEHLYTDTKLGMGISGGLDSSSLFSLVQTNRPNEDFFTFSSCSTDKKIDEEYFVNTLLKNKKEKESIIKIYPEENFNLNKFIQITWHHDEPLFSSSIYAEWEVYQAVKKTPVKVTIEGHGADELLLGYYEDILINLKNLYNTKRWKDFFVESFFLGLKHPYLFLYIPQKIFQQKQGKNFYKNFLNSSYFGAYTQNKNTKLLNMFQRSLFKQLHWADRDSMASSIEARVPFLDHNIVELLENIPNIFKYKNGITKRILRNAFKGKMPETILNRRRKIGFSLNSTIFFKKNKEFFIDSIKFLVKKRIISKQSEVNLIKNLNKEEHLNFLWRLVALRVWLDIFKVKI